MSIDTSWKSFRRNLVLVAVTVGALQLLVSQPSQAAEQTTILTCKELSGTSLTWERAGALTKAGMKGEAFTPRQPSTLILVEHGKRLFFRGNNGQAELKKVGSYFIEDTGVNLVFYRLHKSPEAGKSILIQMKAYDLNGPVSYTVAFECT